jgi:hypothetical protein
MPLVQPTRTRNTSKLEKLIHKLFIQVLYVDVVAYFYSNVSSPNPMHFQILLQQDTVYEREQFQFEDDAYDTVADLITYYVGSGEFLSCNQLTSRVDKLISYFFRKTNFCRLWRPHPITVQPNVPALVLRQQIWVTHGHTGPESDQFTLAHTQRWWC